MSWSARQRVATVGAGRALLAGATDAYAQDSASAHAPGRAAAGVAIRRIVVEGNQRIEPATITSYLLVRPGDTFDPERIDLSLKTLFATGLFADVQIEQRGADLVVSVIENPIINRVIFEGLRTLDEEDLEDEVQARPRRCSRPRARRPTCSASSRSIAAPAASPRRSRRRCASSTRTAST